MIYTPGASALHAARAGIAALYGAALVTLTLSFAHPLVLAALLVSVLAAAHIVGVGRAVVRAGLFAFPVAIMIAFVNALVVREGLTVIVRLGELPPFGQLDVTREALFYGLLFGARFALIGMACALAAATVDPDGLLRSLRPLSFRFALTATLATRMIPVLTRDVRRMHDARLCRPDGGSSGVAANLALVRAVTTGALDRAVDVAATLELRGYASRKAAPRRARVALSRHDVTVGGAAAGLLALAGAAASTAIARVDAYPLFHAATGPRELLFAAAIVLLALLPFADRRGIAR